MRANTPVSAWLEEFLQHQPEATPEQAWRHLTTIAVPLGTLTIGYDAQRAVVIYPAGPHGRERELGKASFKRLMHLRRGRR